MSTLGEFICKVFEKVTETELSGRSCFSLFGEVELHTSGGGLSAPCYERREEIIRIDKDII